MGLAKESFIVLRAARRNPTVSQREIESEGGFSSGVASRAYEELVACGAIDAGGITAYGESLLKPYQVDNAVILAAGLSSRFAPISYEKPKGILKVRGEVLVERQIEQLLEAGVADITVVVGYKKEYFLYLEDKYGVSIVVNPEYASRNNNSSLMAVKDRLSNTYICSSDNYFSENPFHSHMWRACYSAEYQEGPTDEWCIEADDADRIEAVSIGGGDSWYMIGHAYFDKSFSRRFVEVLEGEYDLPETADKLWEQLYVEHIDEFCMLIDRYAPGVIREFDSLDELREFDPFFLENLDSEVFDNIVEVLGCGRDEIRDVYPLKQGLTNLSCHFRTNSGEYVYRHPGVGTEQLIDRTAEAAALEIAKDLGLDGTFVSANPEKGWKISRFIPDCKQLDPHDEAQVARAMAMAAKLHEVKIELGREFDFFAEGKRYESILSEEGGIDVPGYWEMSEKAALLSSFAAADGAPKCLTHNDFFCLNFLIGADDELYLIDWEYAGLGDYANDFGTFVVCCELSEQEALRALNSYFGREATFEEVRYNFAFVALAGWCWYVWSLLKEKEGDFVGEWLYIYYRYAKEYMDKVLGWYETDSVSGEESGSR